MPARKTKAPPPLIRKLDCIRLRVGDLEAALALYRDRLGHELVWRTDEEAGLRMGEGDAEIVLQARDPWQTEIDLLVDSADAAAERFRAAGGEVVVPPFEIRIGRAAVVKDPWGNSLVLLDTSKGLVVTDAGGRITGNARPKAPRRKARGARRPKRRATDRRSSRTSARSSRSP
jgi:predicted enzyme related to lactoylglutathione lyase